MCDLDLQPRIVCFGHDTPYSGTNAAGFAWFDYDDAGNMSEAW
jgi:hypothetical protein